VSMRAGAFFPPPPRPSAGIVAQGQRHGGRATGANSRAGGQAVLDHQPYREINHAVGVLTAGGREIGEVRVQRTCDTAYRSAAKR